MRRIDGFIAYGTAGLFALVGLVVFLSYRANRSDSSSLVPQVAMDPVPVRPADVERRSAITFYPVGQRLPAGYKCSGADGLVYRTANENGSLVVEPLRVGSSLVRCGGTASSFHSYR